MKTRRRPGCQFRFALAALLLVITLQPFFVIVPGEADSVYKVPTANPSFNMGSIVSGSYVNVQAEDGTYMILREQTIFYILNYLDASWNSWQAFSETTREHLLDIQVDMVGYQSEASESWYLQFYDYDAGAWDSTWYSLGSLPTSPIGTLQVTVGDAALARSFVNATGQFRLRIADNSYVNGGFDFRRTDLYIDLLRARFVYDITPPVSSITAPSDQEQLNVSAYTIQGNSSDPAPDPSGVSLVEVSLDGGTAWAPADPVVPGDFSTWIYDWDPISAEGTYNLRSRARDATGNVETPGPGVTVVIDWTPPEVLSSDPPAGEINVGVNDSIQVAFLEANNMLESSINSSTFTLVDEEATLITGAISYDPASKTATLDPSNDLFYGYNYTATVTTGITDLAGNPLPADYSWTFKTADILSMSLVDTYNRNGTPGGGSVSFGDMNPESSPFIIGGGSPPYAVKLWILSSTNWNLTIRATSNLTDNSQVPPEIIPISQMQWSFTGSGLWTPFTLMDMEVFPDAQTRTPQPGGSDLLFDFRMDLNWEDIPGGYSTSSVFILIEQP
ncbi:MAG: Ig-like domain-containing protein [Actinomycetota bacterium]|nr:Ig-like domain-containing protein [Actinomycetota bacterium]